MAKEIVDITKLLEQRAEMTFNKSVREMKNAINANVVFSNNYDTSAKIFLLDSEKKYIEISLGQLLSSSAFILEVKKIKMPLLIEMETRAFVDKVDELSKNISDLFNTSGDL